MFISVSLTNYSAYFYQPPYQAFTNALLILISTLFQPSYQPSINYYINTPLTLNQTSFKDFYQSSYQPFIMLTLQYQSSINSRTNPLLTIISILEQLQPYSSINNYYQTNLTPTIIFILNQPSLSTLIYRLFINPISTSYQPCINPLSTVISILYLIS